MLPEVDPAIWLGKADDDLRSALANLQPGFLLPAQSMWASQQAVEKALKAVLLFLGLRFPFTHDLDALVALMPPHSRPSVDAEELSRLTEAATAMRYPTDEPDPDEEDARRAHTVANTVLCWARATIVRA